MQNFSGLKILQNFKLDKIIFSVRIGKYEQEVELFRGLYALWYCCRYLQGKFVDQLLSGCNYPFELTHFCL